MVDAVGTAMAGQTRRQRLDDNAQREALMAEINTAQRHDGPRRVGEHHGGIVRRLAVRVLDPFSGQPLALFA